jgi:hypothetical protein
LLLNFVPPPLGLHNMKRSSLALLLPAFALCFLSIVYGALSVHFGWWPSSFIADAKNAATALLSTKEEELSKNWPTSMERFDNSGYTKPTVINHGSASGFEDELIFVLGGNQQLRSHCPINGCIAWLMDRKGTIRHVWDIGTELIWKDANHIEGFNRASNIYPVGAQLFTNGDLLLTYQGRNTFPYGVGLAKFDKDSNLLWKKENFSHHWLSVDKDGFIYVPVFSPLETPVQLGKSKLQINCGGGVLQEDLIAILDPDGNEVDRISVLQSLVDSDYLGLVFQAIHSDLPLPLNYRECDPTHLNDVRIISEEDAATSPHLDAGNLIVSLRSINTIAVIDRDTKLITWLSSGRTVLQHSPRYMGDNTLLAFDNLGDSKTRGGSRVVRIDMDTDAVRTIYPTTASPDIANFISSTAGQIELSSDRKRALISLARQGQTLEIDLTSGTLLWEFLNIHNVSDILEVSDNEGAYARFATKTVAYFYDADFSFNEGILQ